jgi:SAM-dependent methyltransferase
MAAETRFTAAVARDYDEMRSLPPHVVKSVTGQIARLCARATATHGTAWILEVGAGTGALAGPLLESRFAYVGSDSSRPMLEQFRASFENQPALVQADLLAMPFPDESFDAMLAFRVFGVVPGWRRGVHECLRVLKPGGHLVVGRVERPPDSLHALVREHRNAWLAQRGFDAGRPGAGVDDVPAALAAVSEQAPLEPVTWTAHVTPSEQIDANLSGWRLQALDAGTRTALRNDLARGLAGSYGDLDQPIEEQLAVVLNDFRKRR